jgi:hypothetical protein
MTWARFISNEVRVQPDLCRLTRFHKM